MSGILKIFKRELSGLLADAKSAAFILVVPIVFIALVGQLRTQPYSFRLLLAGYPEEHWESFRLLQQLTSVRLTLQKNTLADPLTEMRAGHYDLVTNIEDFGCARWRFYAGETDPVRLRLVRLLSQRLARYFTTISERESKPEQKCGKESKKDAKKESMKDAGDARTFVDTFSDLPHAAFYQYYSRTDYSPALMPEITALILCFLPVVVAASGLVREAEEHTLEVILTVRKVDFFSIFLGKAMHSVVVTLFVFLIVLIEAQVLFGIGIKSHPVGVIACLLAGMISTAFVGLIISALCGSSSQAMLATGGYLVGMGVFSGFLYPLTSTGPSLAAWISRFFPLTYASPILKSWMYGAEPSYRLGSSLGWLGVQCVIYGLIGAFLCLRFIRKI
jgi:ABC-type multidrug transport system permease subunit